MNDLKFATYSENGEKYIVLFKFVEGVGTVWSKHFKVKATEDDTKGIKNDGFDESVLFRELHVS